MTERDDDRDRSVERTPKRNTGTLRGFPRPAPGSAEAQIPDSVRGPASSAGQTTPYFKAVRRVLVIDDDEAVTRALDGALRSAGYDVVVCSTACAGVETACAIEPGCIVCEVGLPDANGFWVARALRTQPSAVSVTPILFLSLRDDQASRLEGFHVGADVYMTKPFRVEDVVAQVGALVEMGTRLRVRRETFRSIPPNRSHAIEGDLGQMSIATVLTLLELERRSGTFRIYGDKVKAALELASGSILRSVVDGATVSAVPALRTVLAWKVGRFSFSPSEPRDPPAGQTSITALLMEAVRLDDELEMPSSLSARSTQMRLAPAAPALPVAPAAADLADLTSAFAEAPLAPRSRSAPPALKPDLATALFADQARPSATAPASASALAAAAAADSGRGRAAKTDSELFVSGAIIDKYRIEELLGVGGFAAVYRATHLTLRTPVAIKLLRPSVVRKRPHLAAALVEEARFAARIDHPNVVRVFDVTHTPRITFVVMEYIDGGTLGSLVKKYGPLPARAVLEIAVDVVQGLQAGLERGLIHRDVKPANIMIARSGRAKLVDLGLARTSEAADSTDTGEQVHNAGNVVGTRGYMAPEQLATPLAVDFRADIFSLGVTLYYATVARLPFPTRTGRPRRGEAPIEPDPLGARVPESLSRLLMWMLRDSPASRPASYGIVLEALRSALAELPLGKTAKDWRTP